MVIENYFWNQIMNQIKEEFYKKRKMDEYKLWFGGIKYIGTTGTAVILEVPSIFFQNQLIKRGYISSLERKIKEKTNKKLVIEMKLRDVLKPNLPMKVGGELYGR